MNRLVTLSLALSSALLASEIQINKITVDGTRSEGKTENAKNATISDVASLLADTPGVSLNTGGGFSSLPSIHGMADDRVKTEVDGMQITSACPNHMNPALSYVSPEKVAKIEAVAGITSVSEGGDSIGGTIIVKSADPMFAPTDKKLATDFTASAFYRSNNHAQGIAISATAATDKLNFNYSGSAEKASNYYSGGNTKVADTLYQRQTQSLSAGYKTEDGVLKFKLEQQMVPYEGFANQYMDLNGNKSTYGNLSYNGKIGKVKLDANAFKQQVSHYMNHILTERSGNMPMNTQADEMGYNIKAAIPLSGEHILKIGTDLDKYKLNDWWPAVTATVGGMGPNTFWNINNGHRDRIGIFAESNYQWSEKLATIFGIRTDIVSMNTDNVVGYNTTINDNADATVFNSKDHKKTDYNYDITALVKYEPNRANDIEFGYARKTRSPNLYERYAWAGGYGNALGHASIAMDMAMINWFGDGNGYVGNLDLKPEVAHTVSSTIAWHDEKSNSWNIKITPYYTYVENYIDVDYIATAGGATTGNGYGGIRLFKFANHDAVLFGSDISADANLWENSSFGKGVIKTVINYTRGYRTDGVGSLYHIMPLNAKISMEQTIGNWTNGLYLQGVASKEQVSSLRTEPTTPGYTLVDIKTNYKFSKYATIDLSITNLFDKNYSLPLGGIDAIEKKANRAANSSLRGEGRSFNTAVNVKF